MLIAILSYLGHINQSQYEVALCAPNVDSHILTAAACSSISSRVNAFCVGNGGIDGALPDSFENPSVICAGDLHSRHGTCQGDSGKSIVFCSR